MSCLWRAITSVRWTRPQWRVQYCPTRRRTLRRGPVEAGCPGVRVRWPFTEWPTAPIPSDCTGRSCTAALAMNKWAATVPYVSDLSEYLSQTWWIETMFVSAAVDRVESNRSCVSKGHIGLKEWKSVVIKRWFITSAKEGAFSVTCLSFCDGFTVWLQAESHMLQQQEFYNTWWRGVLQLGPGKYP